MKILGLKKTSLIDYPGKIVSTIFIGGCNFRCPFCHNPDLVFNSAKEIDLNDIFLHLEKRKNLIDGVCITGGEPTIYPELQELLKKIKEKDFLIKLDTNGSNPKLLKQIIKEKLVDFIAMDIKSSFERYHEAAGTEVNLDAIKESITIIKDSNIAYEFRTTMVPKFISKNDFIKICEGLAGIKNFRIQQFNPNNEMIDSECKSLIPYSIETLKDLKEKAGKYFQNCELSNIS
ncbi:MAG: anaerobic ribonucleoside-triphosphate reductase activating protein [Nanoarchaeota archaeon]|nr:anaerobic ribonucleoside-triphosphate reductase activating protein [Nanoarchaeota archaeon]